MEKTQKQEADPIPDKFHFDKNDDFYMAPPTCKLIHYRNAAVMVGILEVLLLCGACFSIYCNLLNALINFFSFISKPKYSWYFVSNICSHCIHHCFNNNDNNGIQILFVRLFKIYGITAEKPQLLIPQITFLHVEIVLLLLGAAGSIASMSLGIEWTHSIFAPIISIPHMELNFGPIWPFNLAIVSFSGAALGIWFEVIVQGCYDYLLDKQYFETNLQTTRPMQLQMR